MTSTRETPFGDQSRNAMLVQLTASDLRALVADAIVEALAQHEPEVPPALVTQDQLAQSLGVSTRTVYTLRERGLPTVYVLESPRFVVAEVLEWLRSMPRAETDGSNAAVLPLPATGDRKLRELTTTGRRGGER